MLFYVRTLLLGPLIVAQGLRVRRTVPVLPEPPGDREGVAGNGAPLRLLIAGDSSAAGVGANHQDEALLGMVVANLAAEFRVSWNVQATSGHKTVQTLDRLARMTAQPFDVAVTSLGVNDALGMVGLGQWREHQASLRELLRRKFDVQTIVVSGLPPVHGFPALPQPLRWHIGLRASQLDRALAADIELEDDTEFIDLRFTEDASLMSSDGFHPGPAAYAEWGKRVAAGIITGLRSRTSRGKPG